MNYNAALKKLQDGNKKYLEASSEGQYLHTDLSQRGSILKQKPFAVILGCSDSRVPAELVFDQGLGDLFVIRVAGHVVAPTQIGSIEFACQQFGTELVVVLGHSHCGAIEATVDALVGDPDDLSNNLAAIVDRIIPAVHDIVTEHEQHDRGQLLHHAMRANVEHSVKFLKMRSQIIRGLIRRDKLKVVGAEYCIETGKVDFYTDDT